MGIDLASLTEEQRRALLDEALKAEAAKVKMLLDERKTYKVMVSALVDGLFPNLQIVSRQLAEVKKQVYDEFDAAMRIKTELYDVPEDQNCHTFINAAATRRITLGSCLKDNYDDTVNEGIKKVKGFLASLAKDAESEMLVNTILKLLSRDQKGNLKPSKVMELRQMAVESGNEVFLDGVHIIEQAYKPIRSKAIVRAECKNDLGGWVNVPLGMTEAPGGHNTED